MKTRLEIALWEKPGISSEEKRWLGVIDSFQTSDGLLREGAVIIKVTDEAEEAHYKNDALLLVGCKDGLGGPKECPTHPLQLQLAKVGQAAIKSVQRRHTKQMHLPLLPPETPR